MGVGLVGLGWVRREGEMGRLGLSWFLWDRPAKPVALAALTGGGWWPQTTANSAAYARGAGDESGHTCMFTQLHELLTSRGATRIRNELVKQTKPKDTLDPATHQWSIGFRMRSFSLTAWPETE